MLLWAQQRNTERTQERDTRASRARVLIYSTADRYWRLCQLDSDSLLVQVSDWCTEFSDTADSDDSDSCSEDPIDS